MSNRWLSCQIISWLAFAALICKSGDAQQPKKLAFVVGVSDYFSKNIEPRLRYAEKDARDMAKLLESMDYTVTSRRGESADRRRTIEALEKFFATTESLRKTDIVLVMLSGHGIELPTTIQTPNGPIVEQRPYFCGYDAKPFDESRDIVRGKGEEEIEQQFGLISINRIIRCMDERSNSVNNLLLVDACRNNPAKGKSGGVSSGEVVLPRGVYGMFAALTGEKSYESTTEDVQNGVFTYFVLRGLGGAAANSRGEVTWQRLTTYVQEEVPVNGPSIAGGQSFRQNVHVLTNSEAIVVLGKSRNSSGIAADSSKKVQPPRPKMSPLVAPFSGTEAKKSQAAWADSLDSSVVIENSIDMKLTLLPPGKFTMGSSLSPQEVEARFFPDEDAESYEDEVPQYSVSISKPFFIGKHEVTIQQFRHFVDATGYVTTAEKNEQTPDNPSGAQDSNVGKTWKAPGHEEYLDNHPVTIVSWEDADAFCRWLSRQEGVRYRLPTQAEWEYACRAGTTTEFSTGDDPEDLVYTANVNNASRIDEVDHDRNGRLWIFVGDEKVKGGWQEVPTKSGTALVHEVVNGTWQVSSQYETTKKNVVTIVNQSASRLHYRTVAGGDGGIGKRDYQQVVIQPGQQLDLTPWEAIGTWRVRAEDGFHGIAPVGSLSPNSLGLFDMHGNVWEWCQDGYDADFYKKRIAIDPVGPDDVDLRAIRGACFL